MNKEFDFIQDVVDDFEGFGSITEMVKNKDLLVEKELKKAMTDREAIQTAKLKMKETLDKAA